MTDATTTEVPPGEEGHGGGEEAETLLHAILTLHEKIRTGEITRRREATGAGAELQLPPPLPERGTTSGGTHVTVGRPR